MDGLERKKCLPFVCSFLSLEVEGRERMEQEDDGTKNDETMADGRRGPPFRCTPLRAGLLLGHAILHEAHDVFKA